MKKRAKPTNRRVTYDATTQQPLATYFSASSIADGGMESDFEREFGQDNPIPPILRKVKIAGIVVGVVAFLVLLIIILI